MTEYLLGDMEEILRPCVVFKKTKEGEKMRLYLDSLYSDSMELEKCLVFKYYNEQNSKNNTYVRLIYIHILGKESRL